MYLLQATTLGLLTVWDTRFLQPVLTWQHPLHQPIQALGLATAPASRLGLAAVGGGGGKGRGVGQGGGGGYSVRGGVPLVYVSAGGNEVGLWDLEQGTCHQVGGGGD